MNGHILIPDRKKDRLQVTLKNLTDPHAVLQAIKEFDELGRQGFLEKYAFGAARQYMLVHEGGYYDSKAIAGVAHLHQMGTLLPRNEFTGGVHGAVRTLSALGFQVVDVTASEETSDTKGAVELLWDPTEQPWPDLDEYRKSLTTRPTATGRWNVGRMTTAVEPGDRIFLCLVGRNRRGLVGSGHATTEIFTAPQRSGEEKGFTTYINVAWDSLVDPANLMPWEDNTQASGVSGQRLGAEQSIKIEAMWQEHLEAGTPDDGKDSLPKEVKVAYDYGIVRRRNHQRAFRALLFRHYEPVCHVCGLDQIEILEAAHIVPDSAGGASSVENGRLLCPNHHRAHDAQLFKLEDGNAVWSAQAKPGLIPPGS